jgi:alkylation response protein AidB-like acyl-CoA dehydrogenase
VGVADFGRADHTSPLTPPPAWTTELVDRAATAGEDVLSALPIAIELGGLLPHPGQGDTARRWAALAALGRTNLTVARVAEAHTDALAILAEAAKEPAAAGSWGVFAAETPDQRLTAAVQDDGTTTLSGGKPWCSLGGVLDHALVTAHGPDGRQLFRVDLDHPTVTAHPVDGWVARGLRTVTSVPISFDRTPAHPVGEPGWYLTRPGFAWGGMGVAACWHGGALGLADTLRRTAVNRGGPLDALHVGVVDAALHASAAVLADAARSIDTGTANGPAGELLALRVRAVVADTVERVLREVGHALGPAPLAFDPQHAARVADLELYVRQHHAERDLAALGAAVLGEDAQ